MVAAPIHHIALNERGIAYISGTSIKVSHIATKKNVGGKTPEDIRHDYPHLSLAQIYAALAYYYDHQAEIEAEIAAIDQGVEEIRVQQHPAEMTTQPQEHKSLDEKLAEIAASIPREELANLPADLGDQLDHYIYGTPKR